MDRRYIMPGYIIVEVRDRESGVRIGGADVEVESGPLTVAKVSDGIYFGFGSDGEYRLEVSAPNYADLFKRVEIAGAVNQKIIRMRRSSN
jgi:hypothetical protein